MAEVVDGRALAEAMLARLQLRRVILGILTVRSNVVGNSFVTRKVRTAESVGVEVQQVDMGSKVSTEDVVQALQELQEKVDGLVVQLPLPEHVDAKVVFASIDPRKDVDALTEGALVRAPVAESMLHILNTHNIPIEGANVVVVGAGKLVGAPCAKTLRTFGAVVTVVDKDDPLDSLASAEIIVSGAGQPHMIKPEHIKDGVVLIDAGTSESAGKVVGDVDPACVAKARLFTPVPGGVGPLSVAMLFKNLEILMKENRVS